MTFIDVEKSVIDTCESLIKNGHIKGPPQKKTETKKIEEKKEKKPEEKIEKKVEEKIEKKLEEKK